MSAMMVWREVPKPTKLGFLGAELKFHLGPELWGVDGSLSTEWKKVGKELIPFLNGLISAGNTTVRVKALELKNLILKHGAVQVRIK